MRVIVNLEEAFMNKAVKVIPSLEKAGMVVTKVMDDFGLVYGNVNSNQMDGLKEVEGVLDVDLERD